MRIFVGQIYIRPGVTFPFSLRFQTWLGDALSERVEASTQFNSEFGDGFRLGLRISAKEDIDKPEIKGPTIFKRDKTVEFTIFLPYQQNDYHNLAAASLLVDQMLQSVVIILQRIGLNAAIVLRDTAHLRSEFLGTPCLLNAQMAAIHDSPRSTP